MLNAQISAENTNTTMGLVVSEGRHLELLQMARRTLQALMDASGLSLEAFLPTGFELDADGDIGVVVSVADEWPKDPPPVGERTMIVALYDTGGVEGMTGEELKSALNLDPAMTLVEAARSVGEPDVTGLVDGLTIASSVDVSGLEGAALRSESSLAVATLGVVGSSTLASSRIVRRSRLHWDNRARSGRKSAPLVSAADRFNHPPDVG